MSELKQTDLSKRLRAKATQPFGPEDFVLLAQAADEIERYYTGMLNWKATAEAQSRTQPEATNPAQDLGGDTRAAKIVDYIYDRCGFVHRDMLVADVARMLAALASPADALVAGDRVDAELLLERERRDAQTLATLLAKERERFEFLHSTNCDAEGWEWGVARIRVNQYGEAEYLWGASDHSDIDAAIQAQKDGHG